MYILQTAKIVGGGLALAPASDIRGGGPLWQGGDKGGCSCKMGVRVATVGASIVTKILTTKTMIFM